MQLHTHSNLAALLAGHCELVQAAARSKQTALAQHAEEIQGLVALLLTEP